MSNNLEALFRVTQPQGALAAESPVAVSAILDNKRGYALGAKAGPPPHSEILKLVHVLFLSSPNAPHHVMFCGVDTEGGSGSVCAAAARALAGEVSSRVCLVEAKNLGPSLRRSFDGDEPAVPSTSLVPHGTVAQQIDRNLWLVSVGHLSSLGVSNGGAEQMCSRLLDLRKEFGYLLVNAPPLGVDIFASVLGQVTDGVVLVLEANATRRVTARRAKETLEAANVPLLGTVLNNRTFPIPEKLYRRL
jgi:Mrp family chromosome partitioning ATPase